MPRTPQTERNAEIFRKILAGVSDQLIASEYSITVERVDQILKHEAQRQFPQLCAGIAAGRGHRARLLAVLKEQHA